MQDLWINQLAWDASLPRELPERWPTFHLSLPHLPDIRIPRWTGASCDKDWHLHGFTDASMQAYAAVISAVIPASVSVILMAKTRQSRDTPSSRIMRRHSPRATRKTF